jgi:putative membrane protein
VLDLLLAIAHHLLVFSMLGIAFSELTLLHREMNRAVIATISAIDVWYGVLAGLILIVGFGRANYAGKGWDYYASNAFFWAKVTTFAVIGLISILPTVRFIRWRKAGGVLPGPGELTTVRRLLYVELALFALLLAFAAAMARGYGQL